MDVWMQFVYALFGAMIYILGGYLKTQPLQEFSKSKALTTIVLTILITLISVAFGITPEAAMTMVEGWKVAVTTVAVDTGILALAEFYLKAIYRRLTTKESTT